jgi:hypothetical protein
MPTGHRQTSAAARIEDPQHAVDVPDDLLVVGVDGRRSVLRHPDGAQRSVSRNRGVAARSHATCRARARRTDLTGTDGKTFGNPDDIIGLPRGVALNLDLRIRPSVGRR